MVKSIAAHVHCRDGKEAHKDTILKVSTLAAIQGISAIFDMPNTDLPILTLKDIEDLTRNNILKVFKHKLVEADID